jgi:hypothetical protein
MSTKPPPSGGYPPNSQPFRGRSPLCLSHRDQLSLKSSEMAPKRSFSFPTASNEPAFAPDSSTCTLILRSMPAAVRLCPTARYLVSSILFGRPHYLGAFSLCAEHATDGATSGLRRQKGHGESLGFNWMAKHDAHFINKRSIANLGVVMLSVRFRCRASRAPRPSRRRPSRVSDSGWPAAANRSRDSSAAAPSCSAMAATAPSRT